MQSRPQRKCNATVSLPPEVWICIFHHATDVPGTLIPDIYAHSTFIGSGYKRYHADLRDALITKRALVRVCKQWWHLAVPFLYQSVYIGLTRCLSSLSRTLVDSTTDKGTMVSTRPLGEYTQRLDVVIRNRFADVGAEFGFLVTILKHMPHLAIAVFAFIIKYLVNTNPADNILDALHYSAPSLRVLDWSPVRLRPSNDKMMNLLTKCTQLRILHYPYLVLFKDLEYDGIPVTVSTLRLLGIHTVHDILHYSDLNLARRSRRPALRELIVNLGLYHSHWADTFQIYGPQLDSVHFYITEVPPMNVGLYMKLLAESCPGLRRLNVTSDFKFIPFLVNFVIPSVTYLGLNATWSQSKKYKFEKFFEFLKELTSRMPSLRVVQLLNESNLRCLLKSHTKFAVRVSQSFETVLFRIEDQAGVLLTDRLKALSHL